MSRFRDAAEEARAVVPRTLYVVATPIGNLGDLSPRAAAVLGAVDRIAAEDTRTTGVLLSQLGITPPARGMVALHEHNEDRIADQLVRELVEGGTLALVSDAGTPLVSDPGFALVRAARAADVAVIAVPGACAAIAALSISGIATDRFVFAGFLPSKRSARRAALQALSGEPRTLVVYESSHRIAECLDDLVDVLGATRRVSLAREISKRFEESTTLTAAELRDWQQADDHRSRGEFVLVIEGAPESAGDAVAAGRVLDLLLRELPPSTAARLAAEITGVPRKQLYAAALRRGGDADDVAVNEGIDEPR